MSEVFEAPKGETKKPAARKDGYGNRTTAEERFRQRKSWFVMELKRQEQNRYQMAMDENYYDSIQWTEQEAAEIRRRGQNPVVYNEVKPTADWLIGMERRMRRDFRVIARGNDSKEAADDAQIKTQLLKYLEDVNRTPFERSQAAKDCFIPGLGWVEVGVRADPNDEPIYTRAESWRNILHDSIGAKKLDLSDGRYLFRFKEVDLDIAQAWFPDKKAELEKAALAADDEAMIGNWAGGYPISGFGSGSSRKWVNIDSTASMFNVRRRVLLIECWSREIDGGGTGLGANTHDTLKMRMSCSIMTEFDTLIEGWSPYAHNEFPFVPVWCYRRAVDGLPYGVIRAVRGPQDSYNKRMSKAQFLLSVNQLRIEADAIDEDEMSLEEIRDEQAAPDGILVFKSGALSGGKVQIRDHLDIAQGHLGLAERDVMSIRSVSGVTSENRGMGGSTQSGKAVIAKQEQGSMVTAEIFDNLLFAHQIEGELTISLIQQYYTEPKIFSVTGERYKLDYYKLNQVDPVTGQKLNDVTRHKATFVISDQPWKQHLAQAAFEQTMQMMGQLSQAAPNVVVAILDLVFEWADVPNKAEFLSRIREVTGQRDPDKDPTPEDVQAQQDQQAQAAKQAELQMAQVEAQIKKVMAEGSRAEAAAMVARLDAMLKAAQAGQILTMSPSTAPAADELLKSAGFQDQNAPQVIDMPAQQPMQPELPPEPQPQAAPMLPPPDQPPEQGAMQ